MPDPGGPVSDFIVTKTLPGGVCSVRALLLLIAALWPRPEPLKKRRGKGRGSKNENKIKLEKKMEKKKWDLLIFLDVFLKKKEKNIFFLENIFFWKFSVVE